MKKTTLNELNEMYKNAPKRTAEYEIDGKIFVVTSHFVGVKDLDKTMYQLAFNRACEETLKEMSA